MPTEDADCTEAEVMPQPRASVNSVSSVGSSSIGLRFYSDSLNSHNV